MGLFSRLFRKRKVEPDFEDDWDKLTFARENVNFTDEKDRSRYVTECLEQISEASRDTQMLTGEYTLVTGYLADTEEIDALPEGEREELNKVARMLENLRAERDRLMERDSQMEDDLFYQLKNKESEIEDGIVKLREAEEYATLVKQDLVRLDREHSAYIFRKQEMEAFMENMRGMTKIFFSALAICLFILAILYGAFEMDVLMACFIAIIAVALAVTFTCVKFLDAKRELKTIDRDINKIIALQNKVKIRYVNNTHLLEYLRMKYSVDSSAKLKRIWVQYKKEVELRRQSGENEAKLELYQGKLLEQLGRYHITDPTRWLSRTNAILDPREMVEVRHELILRRQALRKQMDYNKQVATNARNEIMEVAKLYPAYAAEILKMMELYDDNNIDF